jgi:hypothetical protein
MEHPSEHSIELYVLRAPAGKPERDRIEAHLQECAGCRELADAASSFYTDLQVDILTQPPREPSPSIGISVTPGRPPVIFEPPFREATLSRVRSGGFVRYVRAHPFVAGGGGLALLGGLAFLMLTFDLMPSRDRSLSTVIENQNSSSLDAYNRAGEKLWSCPVPHLSEFLQQERETGRTYLQLADLDGDGRNELITSYPVVPGDGENGEFLHVLNYDKTEIRRIRPGEAVMCRGRTYADEFQVGGFSIGDFSGTGSMEIVVLMNHLHSPSIVSRYDAAGKRLGTYRHFGQLSLMGTKPIADGPAQEFVLYGGSDTEEGSYTAVIVGLDPSRLTGDGESSYSGGFSLPHSPAERFYARIPPTKVTKEFGLHVRFLRAKAVPLKDEQGFRILTTAWPDSVPIYFEYIFRSNFGIVEVKSSNETERLFDRLAAKGLVGGSFFDDYMKVVAGEVRYWDGRVWQARLTPVPH